MCDRKRSVSLSILAEIDLEEVVSYSVSEWGERRADQYIATLNDAFDDIARFPSIGAARNDMMRGMRRYVVKEHCVLYRIEEDEIRIYRIVHARLDLKALRFE